MDQNKLSDFIAYFRQLAAEHVVLKGSFVHGSSGRILSGTRTGITYPALWLETPSLNLNDKDGTVPYGKRSAAFVILQSVPVGDYAAQDVQWEMTEQLALEVLSRMRQDKKARKFDFELSGDLEPISTITVDNEIGWRFEFDLGKYVPICYDATRWQEGGQV
ncbi:hypothetical protein LJY25_08255 [Hymenobacter sp. BT175]|uniref:hypothetical protein n=1 Tax=Hymenobacter translucens TaxID=2886507 RepID=UPI001D0E9D7E|nr:hypothetical protein [Hymenobacter translucens]MCC2546434.1 hypothetical protein [Hymenobacter translucens]